MDIRPAAMEDAALLYEWRRDPSVREQSFHSGELDWDVHAEWLERTLGNEEIQLFIVSDEGVPSGTFRLDRIAEGLVRISITVAPEARGKGLGTQMLREAAARCRSIFGSVTIQAQIKAGNEASLRAFQKAGYRISSYMLELPC